MDPLDRRPGQSTDGDLDLETALATTDDANEALELVSGVDDDSAARKAATLVETLPWASSLPAAERRSFVREVAQALQGVLPDCDPAALARLLEDWRATAEIWAEPAIAKALSAEVPVPLDLPV